jgi:hypothetical protein
MESGADFMVSSLGRSATSSFTDAGVRVAAVGTTGCYASAQSIESSVIDGTSRADRSTTRMRAVPTIRITRTGLQNVLRAYTIVIDDRNAGKIRRGETVDLEVAPGRYTVRVAIARFWTSPTIDLHIAAFWPLRDVGDRARGVFTQAR